MGGAHKENVLDLKHNLLLGISANLRFEVLGCKNLQLGQETLELASWAGTCDLHLWTQETLEHVAAATGTTAHKTYPYISYTLGVWMFAQIVSRNTSTVFATEKTCTQSFV